MTLEKPMTKLLEAHLETGRISNLPTVWSNVFVGYVLAGATTNLLYLLCLLVASSLLYVGGCYLGDAKDVEFDTQHKPTRPIPSGIMKRSTCWIMGWSMMILGIVGFAIIAQSQWQAIVYGAIPLSTVIICYAFIHKSVPAIGLPLIAACRGLLLFSSFLTFYLESRTDHQAVISNFPMWLIIIPSLGLALYTFGFASVARTESSAKKVDLAGLLKLTMLSIPLVVIGIFYATISIQYLPMVAIAILIYASWLILAFSKIQINKGDYVSKCLAGFALLDMVFIAHSGYVNALICLALFGAAIMLQKIAPAT